MTSPEPSHVRLELVEIPAREIYIPIWPRRSPRGELSDDGLLADIQARGLENPVRVRRVRDKWELVFGERRVRACLRIEPGYLVAATIQPEKQDTELGRALSRLADNRQNLRVWELCEELHRLTCVPHCLVPQKIAMLTQIGESYVLNLLRLRRQLSPEIWSRWATVGDSLPVAVLLDVCAYPSAEQGAELAAQLSGRRRGRPRSKRISRKTIERWLSTLSRDQRHSALWCDGAEHALRAALGERRFSDDDR